MSKICANKCNLPVFSKGLCISCWRREHQKPIKKNPIKRKTLTKVKKRSQKRVVEEAIYKKKRLLFLADKEICELNVPGICTGQPETIQHMKGRIGNLYLDETHWKASCLACNLWAADNSAEAVKIGAASYRNRIT